MDDINIAAAAAVAAIIIAVVSKNRKRPRRWGSTNIYKMRSNQQNLDLLTILRSQEATGQFKNFLRMTSTNFENLLCSIGPHIAKKNTKFQEAISIQQRLAVTLRFLASGDSFTSLQYTFKMSKQVISNIIPEVCTALCIELKDYVKLPETSDDWLKISKHFQDTWNLPHCVGAIDGKHIVLQAPIHSGTEFYNYKSFFSIVLFALVDGNCNFLFVDIGCQGRISDGGIFKSSQLWTMIQNASLNLPPSQTLPYRQINIPYFFVGDSAFALHENVMVPYRGNHVMGSKERIFNYRLSRARRNVENAFGIISAVFRVLRKPMLLEPKKAELIVLTTVYLHNYLRSNSTDYKLQILNNTEETTPALTSFLPLRQIPRRSASHVKKIRDEIADYSIKEGKVEWQQEYA